MGFDTIVAAIMATAIIIAVSYTFLSGSTSIAEFSIESYKSAVNSAVMKLRSDVRLLNASYDNSTNLIVAYIKNVGEERYPDFSGFDVIVYGKTEAGEMISFYSKSVSFTIAGELINPGIFDPREVARVEAVAVQPLVNGSYVLMVCTPSAVCDSLDFVVE